MKRSFVFDPTPLMHLAKAGLAPLISQLPGEKLTVPAVVREVVGEGRREYSDAAAIALHAPRGERGSPCFSSCVTTETAFALSGRLKRDPPPGERTGP